MLSHIPTDNIVVSIENLSKQYRLGQIGTGTLSHDLNRWWHRVRGNEDPYLKIGESDERSKKGESEYIWALKGVSFEVKQGEVLGVIGKNGAGKSTLLKILSRVTTPTTGDVRVRGRIASLLEVGTGFHPELTGRENIFLNGAILGMRKREIDRKLDEIIEFSGCERYIDTPVKRYSSGMYVRLAFAVAAHLEPEILIVDEVLAVGDAEFQKKCLGKMREVASGGRTVLFVSHAMSAIEKLCQKGLLLTGGKIQLYGSADDVVRAYRRASQESANVYSVKYEKDENKSMQLLAFGLHPPRNTAFSISDRLVFEIEMTTREGWPEAYITLNISDANDNLIYWTSDIGSERFQKAESGRDRLVCECPSRLLTPGRYTVNASIVSIRRGFQIIDHVPEQRLVFDIVDSDSFLSDYGIRHPGATAVPSTWQVQPRNRGSPK